MTSFTNDAEERAYLVDELVHLEQTLGQRLDPRVFDALVEHTYQRADETDGTLDVWAAWDDLQEDAAEFVHGEAWEEQFEDGLERLETMLGRELFDHERAEVYQHTNQRDPNPIETFVHLHPDGDPLAGTDDHSRRERGKAAADQVFSRAEEDAAVAEADEKPDVDMTDPAARRERMAEIAASAYEGENGED